MKRLGPYIESSPLCNAVKLCSQVQGFALVLLKDKDLAVLGLIQAILERAFEFWKQRDDPGTSAGVMFGLGRSDVDQAFLPIHVFPFEQEYLGAHPDVTEAAKGDS